MFRSSLILVAVMFAAPLVAHAQPKGGKQKTGGKQEIRLDREGHAIHAFGFAFRDQGKLVLLWVPWRNPIPNRGTILLSGATIDPEKSKVKGFDATTQEGWKVNKERTRIDFFTSSFSTMKLHLNVEGDAKVQIQIQTHLGKSRYQYAITSKGLVPEQIKDSEKKGKRKRKRRR